MLKGFNTPEGVSYAPVDIWQRSDAEQSATSKSCPMPRELREEEYDRAKLQSSKVVSSLYAGNAPVIGRVMRYGNKTYKFDGQKLPTGPDHKNVKQIVVEVTPITGDPDIFISLNSYSR